MLIAPKSLVMFDAGTDFDVVSITDATGAEQVLSDDEADALRQHVEAHYDGRVFARRAA